VTVINTNAKALGAANALAVINRQMTDSMQQLSTGRRINSAKDDAAGLAISTRMSADLSSIGVAIRNTNDGVSMMQTADSALGGISNMLVRMRELAVQSANSTLTSSNRSSLQKEMTQLVSEIDNIASTTSFNSIKLLDGSGRGIGLQTGIKPREQVSITLSSASSKSLGLQGYMIEGQLTSGRVGAGSAINADQIKLNGKNVFAANLGAPGSNVASALASAINTNIGEHRVQATAFNVYKGAAPSASVFSQGDVVINSNTVGAASSVEELVANINRDVSGVNATLGSDGTIELSNNTGNDIVITAGTKAGFTSDTWRGYLSLKSLDSTGIQVQAKTEANGYGSSISGGAPAGTIAMVKALGLNESGNGVSFSGGMVDANAITSTTDLRINGVQVGKSDNSSAMAKAAAINAVSAQSGVSATAETKAKVSTNLANIGSASSVIINGKTLDFSSLRSISEVVSTINAGSVNSVGASTDTDGNLFLTSSGGADITVEDSSTFITQLESTYDPSASAIGAVGTAGVGETIKGRITLSSATGAEIRVESLASTSPARTSAMNLIGMASQGGSSTLVGGELQITTASSATSAISVIDNAIEKLSLSRADIGAFQNRLTAAADNLSSWQTNLSTSRSRILDADYAKVTTELARQQIIQQAAQAMLVQANMDPRSVLALMK